jgi:hypothetical protein
LQHQPRRLLLLACTATKRADPHPIPAIERYDGPSFRTLRKWRAANPAAAAHLDVLILSARLGLITAGVLIGDYNQRMTRVRAAELRKAVDAALTHARTAWTILGYAGASRSGLSAGDWTSDPPGASVWLCELHNWWNRRASKPDQGLAHDGCEWYDWLRRGEAPVTVQCTGCGQIWPRDPILEVACPTCHARIGRRCKRPSGHQAGEYHTARDLLAISASLAMATVRRPIHGPRSHHRSVPPSSWRCSCSLTTKSRIPRRDIFPHRRGRACRWIRTEHQ